MYRWSSKWEGEQEEERKGIDSIFDTSRDRYKILDIYRNIYRQRLNTVS